MSLQWKNNFSVCGLFNLRITRPFGSKLTNEWKNSFTRGLLHNINFNSAKCVFKKYLNFIFEEIQRNIIILFYIEYTFPVELDVYW